MASAYGYTSRSCANGQVERTVRKVMRSNRNGILTSLVTPAASVLMISAQSDGTTLEPIALT